MQQRKEYIPCIDFLKGIAIIMVVVVHMSLFIPGISVETVEKMQIGQMGCQLFFVLSGFGVTMSWFRKKQSVGQFYRRRWISIAPGYYLAILLYLGINIVWLRYVDQQHFFAQNTNIWAILCNVFFLNGIFQFCNNNVVPGGWYIGATMLLYAVFPLLIKAVEYCYRKFQQAAILLPVVAAAAAMMVLESLVLVKPGLASVFVLGNESAVMQLPCFLFGIILYYQWSRMELPLIEWRNNLLLGGTTMVLGITAVYNYYCKALGMNIFLWGLFFYFLFVFTYSIWACMDKNIVVRLIEKTGKVSYSIFFVHVPVLVYTTPLLTKVFDKVKLPADNPWIYIGVEAVLMYVLSVAYGSVVNKISGKYKNAERK